MKKARTEFVAPLDGRQGVGVAVEVEEGHLLDGSTGVAVAVEELGALEGHHAAVAPAVDEERVSCQGRAGRDRLAAGKEGEEAFEVGFRLRLAGRRPERLFARAKMDELAVAQRKRDLRASAG